MRELQKKAHAITKSKGFTLDRHVLQLLLVASEVGEALAEIDSRNISNRLKPVLRQFQQTMEEIESLRRNITLSDRSEVRNKSALAEELADIMIRVLSYAEEMDINLHQEILDKLSVNAGRQYLHGKKF